MFTSEFYDILVKSKQITDLDKQNFGQKIGQCMWPEGILCRAPTNQPNSQEQVDDYYGALSGCKLVGNTDIPRKMLKAMFKYATFMDSTTPGKWGNWKAFMLRQPQLIACMVSAGFPSFFNPLHWLMRILALPCYFYAAFVISLSCMGTDVGDTDARRLAWHLVQSVKPTSLMCWLASKIWFKRLYSVYPNGMKDVAAIYYQPKNTNPYAKYWITE